MKTNIFLIYLTLISLIIIIKYELTFCFLLKFESTFFKKYS